ncbi:Terpene cyclase [Mycena sanguinolenta]|uniref:Terpene synthase n=1 Tax=Mycena sanguinolenta TaxID=230812 RepID=A0A8H6X5U9_9AGAR|nr:Terpene cyclase [Mycena sanguinolenta]
MANTNEIILPDLLAQWPFETNPNPLQNIVADSAAWVESFEAFSPRAQIAFNLCKFGIFSSLAYATAGPGHFRAACDLMNLFFVFDEKSDEASGQEVAQQAADIMRALRRKHSWSHDEKVNHLRGLSNLKAESVFDSAFWKRTLLVASQSSAQRFIKHFDEYTDAVRQQAVDRETGHLRSISGYLQLRRGTIGVRPSFDFFLLTDDLPDSAVDHPHIERLACGAIDMTILANDLYSYNVEQSRGDDEHNLITVAMKEKNFSVQQAVDHVGEKYLHISRAFCEDMKNLPIFPDPVNNLVKEYATGMALWVYTNIKWSFASQRYFGRDGPAIEKHRRVRLLAPAEK